MKYSKVPHAVVEAPWFRDADDHARTLALWLWLSPRSLAIPGVVKARAAVVACDLRWSAKRMRAALDHLVAAGVVLVDDAAGIMFLPGTLRETDGGVQTVNRPGSGTAAKTWSRVLDEIQSGPGLAAILEAVEPHLAPFDGETYNEIAEHVAKARARLTGPSPLGSATHSHSHSHRSQTQEQRESAPRPAARAVSLSSPSAGEDPDPEPDPEGNKGTGTDIAPKAPRKPANAPTPVDPAHDHQPAIAAWWAGYEHATGCKPTRHTGHFANVTRLCREHGHAEVTRRMGALLGGALAWLDGTPDLGSLVSHFDKLAVRMPAPPARRRIQEYGGDDSHKVATPPIPFPLTPEAVATAAQELADRVWADFDGDHPLAREVRSQFESHHHRAPSDAELRAAKAIAYPLREAERARVEAERAALAEERRRQEAEAAAHEAAHPDIVKIIDRWRATTGQAPRTHRTANRGQAHAVVSANRPDGVIPL